MKVYTKVVIDMTTLDILEEESYEYNGAVAQCGGGGGGQSSTQDIPEYQKAPHSYWINGGGSVPTKTFPQMMNELIEHPPGEGLTFYDPTSSQTAITQALTNLIVFEEYLQTVELVSDDHLQDVISVQADLLDSEADKTLNRFMGELRSLNAVHTSSNTLGRALITRDTIRAKEKFIAEITYNTKMDLGFKILAMRSELARTRVQTEVEANRVIYVMGKEYKDAVNTQAIQDRLIGPELYTKLGNLLAAAHGGTIMDKVGPTRTQSVLGGAATGAAVGTSVNAGWGTVIGGVVGAAAGYLGYESQN